MITIGPNNEPKHCPKCGAIMKRHDCIYTSYPQQYGYTCIECGEVTYDTNYYPNEDEVNEEKELDDFLQDWTKPKDEPHTYSITREEQIECRKRQWNDLMKKSKEELVKIIMGDPYDITPHF